MNQVAAYKKSFIGRPYGPDGCQVQTTQGRCGETRNLNIINDFQQLYELKLSEIDADGGGDETKAKIELMESWIRDLTEQNRLLIRTVEELEIEATERVQILEDKLREHAKCLCEEEGIISKKEEEIKRLQAELKKLEEDNKSSTGIQSASAYESTDRTSGITTTTTTYPVTTTTTDPATTTKSSTTKATKSSTTKSNTTKSSTTKSSTTKSSTIKSSVTFDTLPDDTEVLKDMIVELNRELQAKLDDLVKLNEENRNLNETINKLKSGTKDAATAIERGSAQVQTCPAGSQSYPNLSMESQALSNKGKRFDKIKTTCGRTITCEKASTGARAFKIGSCLVQDDPENPGGTICTPAPTKEQLEELRRQMTKGCYVMTDPNDPTQVICFHDEESEISERESKDDLVAQIKTLEKKLKTAEEKVILLLKSTSGTQTMADGLENQIKALQAAKRDLEMALKEKDKQLKAIKESMTQMMKPTTTSKSVGPVSRLELEASVEELSQIYADIEERGLRVKELVNSFLEVVPENEECDCLKNSLLELQNLMEDMFVVPNIQAKLRCVGRPLAKILQGCNPFTKELEDFDRVVTEFIPTPSVLDALKLHTLMVCKAIGSMPYYEKAVDDTYIHERKDELRECFDKFAADVEEVHNIMRNLRSADPTFDLKLKARLKELEENMEDAAITNKNMGLSLALYLNSISVLEEAKYQTEQEVQRLQNVVEELQNVLLIFKNQLDELKADVTEDMEKQILINTQLTDYISKLEERNIILEEQVKLFSSFYEDLLESSFQLEMQYVHNYQDMEIWEALIRKYQLALRKYEPELQELYKKNKSYQEVVDYFKHEMAVMAEELLALQQVLDISSTTSKEECARLQHAITQLRRVNDRLCQQLCAVEKQVILENQINRINEARINELQQIIGAKNQELNRHDEMYKDVQRQLSSALEKNSELNKVLTADLPDHESIVEDVESHVDIQVENIYEIKKSMDRKQERYNRLISDYRRLEKAFLAAKTQLEIEENEEQTNTKLNKVKIAQLKERLEKSEAINKRIAEDFAIVAKQLQDVALVDDTKEEELKQYRAILTELRKHLMDINETLSLCEETNWDVYDDLRDMNIAVSTEKEECLCNAQSYTHVFDDLKKTMVVLKEKLSKFDLKGEDWKLECQRNRRKCNELMDEASQKEEMYVGMLNEMKCRLCAANDEQRAMDKCCKEYMEQIQILSMELQKQNEIVEAYYDQQEQLLLLNAENEKLHNEYCNLRCKYTLLEQSNCHLKDQCRCIELDAQGAANDATRLAEQNQELKTNIRNLQARLDEATGQLRYKNNAFRNLEMEHVNTKNSLMEITTDSQILLKNVKLWFEEQEFIKGQVNDKLESYWGVIQSLKTTNHDLAQRLIEMEEQLRKIQGGGGEGLCIECPRHVKQLHIQQDQIKLLIEFIRILQGDLVSNENRTSEYEEIQFIQTKIMALQDEHVRLLQGYEGIGAAKIRQPSNRVQCEMLEKLRRMVERLRCLQLQQSPNYKKIKQIIEEIAILQEEIRIVQSSEEPSCARMKQLEATVRGQKELIGQLKLALHGYQEAELNPPFVIIPKIAQNPACSVPPVCAARQFALGECANPECCLDANAKKELEGEGDAVEDEVEADVEPDVEADVEADEPETEKKDDAEKPEEPEPDPETVLERCEVCSWFNKDEKKTQSEEEGELINKVYTMCAALHKSEETWQKECKSRIPQRRCKEKPTSELFTRRKSEECRANAKQSKGEKNDHRCSATKEA